MTDWHLRSDTPKPHQVIHIGQRKTGTTWLQGTLAAAAESTKAFAFIREEIKLWARENSQKEADETDWPALTGLLSAWREKDVVISLEALIAFDHDRMAAALAEALPRAVVLVTTRSPNGRLQSAYSHAIRAGHRTRPEKYLKKFIASRKARSNDLRAVVVAYEKAFGGGAVRFLPFEFLRNDQAGFLQEVSRLCGVDLSKHVVPVKNPNPPEFYLALVQKVGAQLSAIDPRWAETEECNAFLKIASHSTAYARELWPFWEQKVADFHLTFEKPQLPAELLKEFAEFHSPLRNLPLYQPYLAEYGLAP